MITRVLAVVLFLGASGFAQWTEVQKAWNSTAGASPATTTVSLPSVGTKHVVLASVLYLGTATGFTMAVTDGNGHSFTQTPNSPCIYSTGEKVWLFYITNTPAASMTVTATPSVAHGVSVHAVEFTPDIGVATFDSDVCANPTSGTTPINTPSITPRKSGVLYAAALVDPNTGTGAISAAGGSWTGGTQGIIASDSNDTADEYQFAATGATTVNWTTTGSAGSGWVAMSMSMFSVPPPNMTLKGKVAVKGKIVLK